MLKTEKMLYVYFEGKYVNLCLHFTVLQQYRLEFIKDQWFTITVESEVVAVHQIVLKRLLNIKNSSAIAK